MKKHQETSNGNKETQETLEGDYCRWLLNIDKKERPPLDGKVETFKKGTDSD